MNEMKIKLFMNDQKDITVTNLTNSKNFVISYSDKVISAISIYNMLDYKLNNTYILESNIEDITDENDNTYFSDIITLLNDIKNEINDMIEEKADNETVDLENGDEDSDEAKNSFEDLPF